MVLSKKDWILLALSIAPLDRIRLMKALFLVWIRSGRKIQDYFEFQAHFYGPCSFEFYSVVSELVGGGLIVQAPHAVQRWGVYHLTTKGKKKASRAASMIGKKRLGLLEEVVHEVSQLPFYELLRRVYSAAPDFAKNSLVREVYGE